MNVTAQVIGTQAQINSANNVVSAVKSHVLTPLQSLVSFKAPVLTRYSTVSLWSPSAAQCRGVL